MAEVHQSFRPQPLVTEPARMLKVSNGYEFEKGKLKLDNWECMHTVTCAGSFVVTVQTRFNSLDAMHTQLSSGHLFGLPLSRQLALTFGHCLCPTVCLAGAAGVKAAMNVGGRERYCTYYTCYQQKHISHHTYLHTLL